MDFLQQAIYSSKYSPKLLTLCTLFETRVGSDSITLETESLPLLLLTDVLAALALDVFAFALEVGDVDGEARALTSDKERSFAGRPIFDFLTVTKVDFTVLTAPGISSPPVCSV